VLTTYTVPLTGAYTFEDAGLQIVPGQAIYGPQATGATGLTRLFTIDNLTQLPVTLSIALPRQFVLSGPACAGLAPGASCSFPVTFLPLTNGDLTGTLFAQATPANGSATLNGIGYVEGFGLGSATLAITGGLQPGNLLNFGQVASGQSTACTLTLTNSGTAPLTVRRISSGWPFLGTSTCGLTLAAAQTCTVTLTYTPLNQVAAGTVSPPPLTDAGTLTIESDAVSSPDFIDLAGTSTATAVAVPVNTAPLVAFSASQNSLTFAATSVGNVSTPQTVTLANTGNTTLHILGLQTTPDFTVASACAAIVPGQSCAIAVTFTPQNTTAATRIASIEIASDASTSLEFISLIGTSTPAPLTLSATALNFGTVNVGASATLPLQITNTAASAASFISLSASGDFSAANGTCPAPGASLAPSQSCTAQITFTPTASGTRAGTLSLATSASTLPLTVSLTGVGAQSHLQVTPGSLSFGSLAVGASASLQLTLTDSGSATVSSIALAVSGDYAITTPCAVTALAPGAGCPVVVTFTPTAIGTRSGTLTVTSSDASSPALVPLTGTGIASGTFTLSAASAAAVTVKSGSPATYSLALTPINGFAGTVILNCTPIAPAQYAYCSLQPSSLTLTGAAQNATVTITTVASIAALEAAPRSLRDTLLCLLLPTLLLSFKARTSRHRAWRRLAPLAWIFLCTAALLSAGGCGGGSNTGTNNNLRYASTGSYQYQVTATSASGSPQIAQSVALTLTVQ
jgi:hypothetical protein